MRIDTSLTLNTLVTTVLHQSLRCLRPTDDTVFFRLFFEIWLICDLCVQFKKGGQDCGSITPYAGNFFVKSTTFRRCFCQPGFLFWRENSQNNSPVFTFRVYNNVGEIMELLTRILFPFTTSIGKCQPRLVSSGNMVKKCHRFSEGHSNCVAVRLSNRNVWQTRRVMVRVTPFPEQIECSGEVTDTLIKPKFKAFFCTDASNGYWAVPIKEDHQYRTGFVTPHGQYIYPRMGQGLKGACATYLQFGDLTFGPFPEAPRTEYR